MRGRDGLLVALVAAIGAVIGSVSGAIVAGQYSSVVAVKQMDAQKSATKSEAALKLFELRSKVVGDIFSTANELNIVDASKVVEVSQRLAAAASIGMAVLDGKSGKLCGELKVLATGLTLIPIDQPSARFDRGVLIGNKVGDIREAYAELQKDLLETAMGGFHQ